jgi:glycosyltransferase involved in cell wall biosynthesis
MKIRSPKSSDAMTRRRILHVIEDLGIGGAERLLVTLLPEMRARGFDPVVASLGCRLDSTDPLEAAGIRVSRCGLVSKKQATKAVAWLVALIRRERYDLVHTHLTFANLYGRIAARLSGVPVTTTYHDADYEREVLLANPAIKPWKQTAYRLADRLTSLAAPRVVAVSEFVAASIQRRLGYSERAIQVIYNGVRPEAWAEVDFETKRACRLELGLPIHGTIVLQVGRLSPQKGQTHTLEVAKALRGRPDLCWVFVGDGPLQVDLERAIADARLGGRVMMVGGRSDVHSFLAAADLFIFPSFHEGLGIAALEAMGAGLPVIAYRSGPLPEVITDGTTGILVTPGDVPALTRAVVELVADRPRARELGQRARESIVRRFSIGRTADQHAALYARLLEAR